MCTYKDISASVRVLLLIVGMLIAGRESHAQYNRATVFLSTYSWLGGYSGPLYVYDDSGIEYSVGLGGTARYENFDLSLSYFDGKLDAYVNTRSGDYEVAPFFAYPISEDKAYSNPLLGSGIPPDHLLVASVYNPSQVADYDVSVTYAMPIPRELKGSVSSVLCANENISLNNYDGVIPYSNKYVKISVLWEYSVNGSAFQQFSETPYAVLSTPAASFVGSSQQKVTVRFQYRYKAQYATQTHYSPYSPISSLEILPAAPSLTKAPVITPSCNDMSTGKVTIAAGSINSQFPNIKWLLKKGNSNKPCDPLGTGSNACGAADQWSSGSITAANGFEITGVRADSFTLWISNADINGEGACLNHYLVVVPELPAVTVTEDQGQHRNVSCHNAGDGSIQVTAAGGDTGGKYSFTLFSGTTVVSPRQTINGRTMSWSGLTPGQYWVQVENSTCTKPAVSGQIEITQPPLITGDTTFKSPVCASPGDGLIGVTAMATDGNPVSNYLFNLYKDGAPYRQSGPTPNNAYNFTDLPGGSYRIEILNNDAQTCAGWTATKTLATLVPLKLNLVSRDSVSCNGGSDGTIHVAAAGGSANYVYTLTRNGVTATNKTGDFTGLSAGNYTVSVKNDDAACNDIATLNITVFQRAPLVVQLNQTPVSCYGKTDARISTTVNGGSGSYSYNWQELRNGVWTDGPLWLNTDTQIEDLPAGTYRVIITDKKASGCTVTSAESIVKVATLVQVTNVTVHDAVCLANGAHIDMTATGGTGTYVYEWSLDGGNSYHPFTANTDITTAGNYALRVTDGHGCIATAASTYNIILPSAPVSFTYSLSDYAGYNISCKNNDNGFAQIIAQGGNDGPYSGYSYALDNDAYNTSSLVEHINAGQHTLYVKDGRGCVVTQQIVMTEPAAVLALAVSEQEHPGCGADPIGHITVQANGGATPYSYSIDNGAWQEQAIFEKLISRDYGLRVKDATGCITGISTTLTSAYPPLATTADITPVSCYAGADGRLALHVTGGDGSYRYQWSTPSPVTGSIASNLTAGDYLISVTDSKDCRQQVTFTVPQPDPLALNITAPGICDGFSNGSITTVVTGGTAPYKYSLDHSSWLPSGTFNGLPAADYLVAVEDAHNCSVSQVVKIIKINVKPEVNFLVASRLNAFDTLAIKEISIPAPDAVDWKYDPAATWLGDDNGTPLIKFTNPGTYWIEMSGRFGECTYTLRKELEIGAYDPQAGPGYSLPVQVIDTVTMSPNPNNGTFNFRIKLNRKQQIVAYIYDMNGIVWGKKQYAPTLEVNDVFTAGGTATGTFILRVITESESRDVRFIISR